MYDKLIGQQRSLIMMIGLPRSGKSTWAKEYADKWGVPVVSLDAIRLTMHGQRFVDLAEPLVWYWARIMVKSLFLAGHDQVIVDESNINHVSRKYWLARDSQGEDWKTLYKHIQTSAETCIERAEFQNDDYIVPVIKDLNEQFDSSNFPGEPLFEQPS